MSKYHYTFALSIKGGRLLFGSACEVAGAARGRHRCNIVGEISVARPRIQI